MNKKFRDDIIKFLAEYNITQGIMQDHVMFARALGFDVYNADPKSDLYWVCSVVEDPATYTRENLELKSKKNIMFYSVPPKDARSILMDEIACYIYTKLYINDQPCYAHINDNRIMHEHRSDISDVREILQNLELCGMGV